MHGRKCSDETGEAESGGQVLVWRDHGGQGSLPGGSQYPAWKWNRLDRQAGDGKGIKGVAPVTPDPSGCGEHG